MKKLVWILGMAVSGMAATACMGDEVDLDVEEIAEEELGELEEGLLCDDCDPPPTGGDPLLIWGPFQEIPPGGRVCSFPLFARYFYNVYGEILPRGSLNKPVKVQVFQGTARLLNLPVQSGGFSVTLNTTNSPSNFPGSFVTCIKNPASNWFSVDARANIHAN